MSKRINQRWRSLLLATIATFIVLSASGAIFAQKADKYPKPDFSAMEEYFEVVEYEYDFALTKFVVIAKAKQKVVLRYWDITWYDAKGLKIAADTIIFNMGDINRSKIGEPIEGRANAPFKRQMAEVKSVKVTENPSGGDAKTAN